MYTDFYNLKKKPFNLNPSSRFLYLGEVHKEALALLNYGVAERKSFTLLTGEVGTGKTTMIHALLADLGNNTRYVYLSNPVLSAKDFWNYLGVSVFKKKVRFESKTAFLLEFETFLKKCLQHQKNFILIIDEAHKLSFELLEEIRLLSNMETSDEKLINIFLSGQPELNEKLSQPRCRPLLQRISARFHIDPLDLKSTREYILKRLEIAGAEDGYKIFSKSVIKAIHHYSKGYPRMINILGDNALLLGYARGTKKILPPMIKECFEDLQLNSVLPKSHPPQSKDKQIRNKKKSIFITRWKWAAAPLILVAVSAAALIAYEKQIVIKLPDFASLNTQASANLISEKRSHIKKIIEQRIQQTFKKELLEKPEISTD